MLSGIEIFNFFVSDRLNSFENNCNGKQNEWYFKYPLSTRNVDHENKLH